MKNFIALNFCQSTECEATTPGFIRTSAIMQVIPQITNKEITVVGLSESAFHVTETVEKVLTLIQEIEGYA